MNDNQTYNSIVFNLSYKDKAESLRRSSARDITTPDDMIVRSSAYVDPANKIAGTRYTLTLKQVDLDANNELINSYVNVQMSIPSTLNSTRLAVMLATVRAQVAASGILEAIINNEK